MDDIQKIALAVLGVLLFAALLLWLQPWNIVASMLSSSSPQAIPSANPSSLPSATASPSPVAQQASPSPSALPFAGDANQSARPSVVPVDFKPIFLNYSLKGIGKHAAAQLWISNSTTCGTDCTAFCSPLTAFTGVARLESPSGANEWKKITIYPKDGFIAWSFPFSQQLLNQNAQSSFSDVDFALTLNSAFAQAGRNFNIDYSSSAFPVSISNVWLFGTHYASLQVRFVGASAAYSIPCMEYLLEAAGAQDNLTVCVASPKDYGLPYVVHLYGFGGLEASLLSNSNSLPDVLFASQCIEGLRCSKIAPIASAGCDSDGTMMPALDSSKCISSYTCSLERTLVVSELEQLQLSGCGSAAKFADAVSACRAKPDYAFYPVRDAKGCIVDITCSLIG
ncbi:MAG: hypothetical protein WC408_04045 [Candidatus Micrarchaeia archaeon]|jgi:hypothetical protein